jgi:hypothetical protein
MTEYIYVQNTPSSLFFQKEPPETVEINQIFNFVVHANINSGSPLDKLTVRCNTTGYYTQLTMPSKFVSNIA